ncbi:AAA family ATPase [Streptomyces sp. NPDC004111]|uniref:helix-turn-helix transcriptional regulator n=1 Tax=Streptomyces sp. NPDC004111 TaxID=3364690 RepID=UPI0036A37C8A
MGEGSGGALFVGRQRERRLLERALDSARSAATGSALALRGEAGIGKTALLDWAAARAEERGFTVLRAAGHESETGVAFGALTQVLGPLWPDAGDGTAGGLADVLHGGQREALEKVLGLSAGLPPDGFMVGASALALLAALARGRPVLVLVDDLHWVDSSSAAVLAFVGQRICGLRAVLVCTGRPGASAWEGWSGHPVDIGALSGEDSRALLRHWHPGLAGSTVDRVTAEAAGNPLALAELPGQLAHEQRSGVVPLPDQLPLGQRLEALFVRRLEALGPHARELLLRAALDSAGAAGAAGGFVRGPHGAGSGAERLLARVEASGLARLDDTGRLVFRHPLVRSAVIASASENEKRLAHSELAARMRGNDPRRLLHEASAAEGPDEPLAVRLQEAGTHMSLCGGDAEAALLLDRAAALSARPDDRVRRLTWAAVMSARGGRLAYAARLVDALREERVPPDIAPLFAYAVVYVDQSHHIDFASTFELLPGALAALRDAGPRPAGTGAAPRDGAVAGGVRAPHDLVEQMVFKLLLASVYTGDPRGWEALELHRDHLSPAARLCLRAWADPPRTAHGAQGELRGLVARASACGETGNAWLLLWAATAVDGGDADLWRLFSGEHAYATQGSVAKARCHQAFLEGRWETAGDALAAAETAAELGYHCNALLFRHYHAHFLAGRGDERGLRAVRAGIDRTAEQSRMRYVTEHLDRLEALVALAHGRHEEAYARLRRTMPPGGPAELPHGPSWFHVTLFDFVVASVRTGRRAAALAQVAAGRAARMDEISAHHAFLLAAATALTASGVSDTDDAAADAAYAAACAVPDAGRWVFDLARLRLEHGSRLRRRGRAAEAGEPLRAALRAFEELDAAPWADRCQAELRTAAGAPAKASPAATGSPRSAPPAASDRSATTTAAPAGLTDRELRIARLVATGLTNKEVGAELGLSPRTVAAHLYRIFPKLGITSRAALARALREH